MSVKDVELLVEGGFLDAYDYIYIIKKKKWYLLGELKPFAHLLPAKPLTEIILEQPYIHTSENGKVQGPFTKTQIKNKIELKEIKYFDYIFVEGQKDWIPIKSIPVFREHFNKLDDRPQTDPTTSLESKREFLLSGGTMSARRTHTETPKSVLVQDESKLPSLNLDDLINTDFSSSGQTDDIAKLIEAAAGQEDDLSEEENALLDSLPDPKRNIPSPAVAGIAWEQIQDNIDIDPSLEGSRISSKLTDRFKSRRFLDKKHQIERRFAPSEHKLPVSLLESLKESHTEVDINNPHLQSAEEIFSGDTFEIKNAPIWILKGSQFGNKAHTFSEILNLKNQNLLNDQTEIKQKGTMAWKRLAEIYEFNTEVIRKKMHENGVEQERIFLKRRDLRVSYYSPAVVIVDGKKYQGFCTSISMGGCFIELGKMDIVSQKEAIIRILPGAIPITIESNALIMRVLNQKPRGLGLKFRKLPTQAEKSIEDFIRKYLDTTSKRPA